MGVRGEHLLGEYGIEEISYAISLISAIDTFLKKKTGLHIKRVIEDVEYGNSYVRFGQIIEQLLGPKTYEHYEDVARVMAAVDFKLGLSKVEIVGGIDVTEEFDNEMPKGKRSIVRGGLKNWADSVASAKEEIKQNYKGQTQQFTINMLWQCYQNIADRNFNLFLYDVGFRGNFRNRLSLKHPNIE